MQAPAVKKFIRNEFDSQKLKIAGYFLMGALSGFLEVVGIGLVFPFIYVLIRPEVIHTYSILAYFVKIFHIKSATELNIILLCMISILIFFKTGYIIFFRYLQMKTLINAKTNLSGRLMRMYLFSDYSLHMEKTSSEIIKNVALAPLIYDQYLMSIFNITISITICLGLSGLILLVLPLDAIFSLSVISVAVLVSYKSMKKKFAAIGKEANEIYQERQKVMTQSLGAIRDTKVLGRENYFTNVFKNTQRKFFRNQQIYSFLSQLPATIMEAWIMVSIMVVILLFLHRNEHAQAVATLSVLLAAMFRMLPQVNKIIIGLQLLNNSSATLKTISEEFAAHEKNIFIPTDEMEEKKLPFNKKIEFRNVSYSYPKQKEKAVHGINIIINKNEFIGLTGPSGGGKSTILNLLLGLVDPIEGSVIIDNFSLTNKETKRLWQNNIGYVPQSLYIIQDSILNNIAYGIDKEKVDQQRAFEAARSALLEDFLQQLPNGIHQNTGEAGSKLSGGQRQRIGIARALYNNPAVLALDEATNGLDAHLENEFIKTIHSLKGTRTVIMITHKLNSLKLCDRIIVVNKGEVVDYASFDQLQARCDLFRGLLQDTKIGDNKEETDAQPAAAAV